MRALHTSFLTMMLALALTGTTAMADGMTFAQTGQTNNTPQFWMMNSGGTVTITGSGQDFFTFLVGGTPFNSPILANFVLNATSTQSGACGSIACPGGDSFSEQGYTGTFSYTVAGGTYIGQNLLSGGFTVNATPTNSGGKFTSTIGGSGGGFSGTQTAPNLNGIWMTSDFMNFAGVATETGAWALSGLDPQFVVDATLTHNSMPPAGRSAVASNVATFSALGATAVPEPATMALIGAALLGLGLIRRGRLARQLK